MSLRLIIPIWAPGMPGMSKVGRPAGAGVRDLKLDLLVVELAVTQFLAELLRVAALAFSPTSASSTRSSAMQFGLRGDVLAMLLAHHVDGDLDEIADDLFDIAADIADFGEFRRFHFEKRRLRQFRQAAGDLGLADTGRADHQDVLRQHLVAHFFGQLLATPTVAQRNGDGALGVVLADDVAVEFGDDLAGAEIGHTVSRTTDSLV